MGIVAPSFWRRDVPLPTISGVFLLHDAIDEAGDAAEGLLARIADAVRRDLHATSGSTLKRLRGPWDGRAFRVRWGRLRATVSVVPAEDGAAQVFVHQVASRDEIYESNAFWARLDRFHRDLWVPNRGLRVPPEQAGYHHVPGHVLPGGSDASMDVSVEPVLSEHQFRLLNAIVPFPESWGVGDAVVVIGKGPPGSGKTIAAIDAARRAVETCHYSVLLLAPTARLRAHYEDALRGAGIPAASVSDGYKRAFEGIDLIWVGETGEFFMTLADVQATRVERERLLDEWWSQVLEDSTVRPWASRNPPVRESRFARLLDAVLEDPSGLDVNEKDALDTNDAPLYELVREFRSRPKWVGVATELRTRLGLKLRSEIAGTATTRLQGTEFCRGTLLVIVDETQDLVHGEWKALIDWCAARCRGGAATRLTLIGDENQRISPTSFSWAEVKRHCADAFKSTTPPLDEWELPGSFRLSRKIAALANELFDPSITQDGKFRHVERADPADLPQTGEVRVVVVPGAARAVVKALRRFDAAPAGPTRLRVITDALQAEGWTEEPDSRADVLPPRAIKGLEFGSLVVVEPLGGRGAHLSYGEATVAYTSLTRAIEDLLCVLTPAEWSVVRGRWAGLGVSVEELDGAPASVVRLEELFRGLAGATDAAEQALVEEEKLAGLLDRLPSSGSTWEAGRWLRDVGLPAKRLVGLGRLEQLARDYGGRLRRKWLDGPARGSIREAFDRGDWRDAVGMLILLGEHAAAVDVVERWAPDDDEQVLAEACERVLSLAGATQRTVMGFRRTLGVRPEAESASLLRVGVAVLAHQLVQSAELPAFAGGKSVD